jgi:hypothetical protein
LYRVAKKLRQQTGAGPDAGLDARKIVDRVAGKAQAGEICLGAQSCSLCAPAGPEPRARTVGVAVLIVGSGEMKAFLAPVKNAGDLSRFYLGMRCEQKIRVKHGWNKNQGYRG